MKAKKTKLTAATLGAFLAFGGFTLASAAGNTPNSNSGRKPLKSHKSHHKGGKKSKKNSGGSTTPPPK